MSTLDSKVLDEIPPSFDEISLAQTRLADPADPAYRTESPPLSSGAGNVSTDNVRVLHVVNGEHYSGAARVQDLLAMRLPEFGFEVSFACVKPNLFPKLRKAKHVPLHETPMRSGFDIRPAWKLAKIATENNCQIVHAHTPRSILVGRLAASLAGLPLVFHVHSPTSRDSSRPLQNWLNDKVERLCVRGASRLIPVSDSLALHMRQAGFAASRLRTAPNGTPCLASVDRPAPKTPWVLGMVALFRPRKGLDRLIEALGQLKHRGVDFRFNAVGPFETPEYEAQIHELARRLGVFDCIEWVGMSEDVEAELRRMDLFVLPSLFGEGLPMVMLEAMSAGVPVVATRVEGIPEVITDGVHGVLAEANDAESLAEAIRRITEGELCWRSLRTQGLERHRDGFSDRAMAESVAAVYREVLGERDRRAATL